MTKALRVLIVEDDPDFAESLASYLELYGHEVDRAVNAEEALAHFARGRFDLAVVDVSLPGMDGVACFFELRKAHTDARVLLMTAHRLESRTGEAVGAGALGVLRKPFDPDTVCRVLESV